MTAHIEILPEDTLQTLSLLRKLPASDRFYLAGGTAAALHLGHRISGDLDFFCEADFNEDLLIQRLSGLGEFKLEKRSEQTVLAILNNTKLSFFVYKYPLLSPLKNVAGIPVSDIMDIACMKIDTIASRGAKRDFIDLYFILRKVMPLEKALRLFEKKYAAVHYNMMHIKKSLVYFEDAEEEPSPIMIQPVAWEEVKKFFREEIARLFAGHQGPP